MEFKIYKKTALPSTLEASAIYFVSKPDNKFDLVLTNNAGNIAFNLDAVTLEVMTQALATKFDIPTGTAAQYIRGNGTLATLNSSAVGLGNVENISPMDMPVSTATQAAIDAVIMEWSGIDW